jgi:hypothetical protein
MAGEDEAVIDRPADAEAVEAGAVTGGDHTVVLHEEPPTYTLSVEYGDFDALFNDVSTVRGRQERMQAVGFYYGAVDDDEGSITRRCSRHLRDELGHSVGHTLTDEEFTEQFNRRIRCTVRKSDGSLEPETDFTSDARVVFPGTFCFRRVAQLGDSPERHRFNSEQTAWNGNRGLGKIPLIARVTNTATGDAVAGMRVCFEFIPAFDPPRGQLAYLSHVSSESESTSSPREYIRGKLHHSSHAAYGYNCPSSKGGKTPDDVLGHLIAQGEVPGFPYQAGNEGRPNNFSATVDTDDSGAAGIVLLPSRMAGDCYKLKVRVIIEGREPIASEIITSGILTIWRNLRISRIIHKRPQAGFAGEPMLDAEMMGALGSIQPSTMRTEYTKAFHLLEVDHSAAHPVNMTERSYHSALAFAKRHASNPAHFDLDALILNEFNSPYLFWLDTDVNYNANKTAVNAIELNLALPLHWRHLAELVSSLSDRFMEYWSGGALPGITIIRSEVGDSYSYWNRENLPRPRNWSATSSGVATRFRGCFLWYPEEVYAGSMPYDITRNAMHEMGHNLFLRHHYTSRIHAEDNGFPDDHDTDDFCLMGYLTLTTNDYCGKCLLKLRGWDESAI